MSEFKTILDINYTYVYVYSIICFIGILYIIRNIKLTYLNVIIIYSFLYGFISLDIIPTLIFQIYKILYTLLLLNLYIKGQNKIIDQTRTFKNILLFIILATYVIFITFIRTDSVKDIIAYLFNIFNIILLILTLDNIKINTAEYLYSQLLLYKLIKYQIICSIIKLFIIGFNEAVVGTIAISGGSVAVIFPLVSFIYIWLMKEGKINRQDISIIILLCLLPILSNKRAFWFIAPIEILLLITTANNYKKYQYMWIMIIPLLFYFGVRVNPSLNPENKIGGSFNINYVISYVESYQSGREKGSTLAEGRNGANKYYLMQIINDPLSNKRIYGNGIENVRGKTNGTFDNTKYGISTRGNLTGFGITYITIGYLGIILLCVYIIAIIYYKNNYKCNVYRNMILLLFIYDFFFYTGVILTHPTIQLIWIWIIYSTIYKERRLRINEQKIGKVSVI